MNYGAKNNLSWCPEIPEHGTLTCFFDTTLYGKCQLADNCPVLLFWNGSMDDIRSLSFRFDPVEDRLAFVCRSKQVVRPLLITRRLAFRLLGRLCELVAQQNTLARQADPGWRDEVLSMAHARSVAKVDEAQQDAEAQVTDEPPLPVMAATLLTRIDLQPEAQHCDLMFFSGADVLLCRVRFTQTQLHWFVSRLHKYCHKAEWGNPVPEPTWLQDEPPNPAASGRAAMLH